MVRVDDYQDDEADSELARHVRAGVYQRVSKLATAQDHREIERARSINEQNKANQDECDQHGWTVTERYEDPGLSASRFATKARPEYRRLLADIQAGKLDVVVLWESSRGDRELAGWAQFLNACRENRTRIYITTHGRLYDMDNGRDWRSLAEDGVDSAYESEKTSTRVRRTVAATMRAGEPFGHCPYGYEREYHPRTRKLIEQRPSTEPANPDDEDSITKADVIRRIFRELAKGTPVNEVRRWLNSHGIPAPEGSEWGRSVIQRIARNPVYIGKRRWRHHDGLLDGNWAPIIDQETFWTVQRILSDPKRKTTRPGSVRHMLSFLATCGQCGGELVASTEKRSRDPIYRCHTGCVHIRADWLDDYISLTVIDRLSRPDVYPITAVPDKEAIVARTEVAELRTRLDEHADLAAEGKISPLSFARIEQNLLAKIAEADRRAELAAVPPVLRDIAGGPYEQVEAKWEGLPVAARKELCRVLFEKIGVMPRTRLRRPVYHRGRFEVSMVIGSGREKFIGSYATMPEAIKARNAKYAELGITVTDDDVEAPAWHQLDPRRITVRWRDGFHAAGISSA